MDKDYRICSRCVLDTTDPDIQFDDAGVCNHCRRYDDFVATAVMHSDDKKQFLRATVKTIQERGKGRKYDCIIGVSGGVDSTYLAYIVKELGLRPLAVHLDNGWDSELAVSNIEKVLNNLNIDLFTRVLDWEEFRDLQKAFLFASTPDSEIPSDHAIVATLYDIAVQEKIKYIILGTNIKTEFILPRAWSQGHTDWKYIRSVNRIFNQRSLRAFPHTTFFDLYLGYKYLHGIKLFSILDYVEYDRKQAMEVLQNKLGWVYYGGKHYESIYTRFYQGYILPRKFGYDKRRAHLSNLICSGQMTRTNAHETLKTNPYPTEEMEREDKDYVIKKLDITATEFESIMALPAKTIADYPSQQKSFLLKPIKFLVYIKAKLRKMIKAA